MTATVLDLATSALTDIGVLQAGEVPDAGQCAHFLTVFNNWLDEKKADRLMISTITRATATLTASQASFTVGTGGNVNIPRPVFIERVGYVDNSVSPAVEFSLGDLLTEAQYQSLAVRTLASTRPSAAYYNPTYPLGTLIPWPIPTAANLLWSIYYAAPVDEFAAITSPVALPPGYRRMLVKNMAVELLAPYTREPQPLLIRAAADSMATVKRSNERRMDMQFPAEALPAGGNRGWDIRVG